MVRTLEICHLWVRSCVPDAHRIERRDDLGPRADAGIHPWAFHRRVRVAHRCARWGHPALARGPRYRGDRIQRGGLRDTRRETLRCVRECAEHGNMAPATADAVLPRTSGIGRLAHHRRIHVDFTRRTHRWCDWGTHCGDDQRASDTRETTGYRVRRRISVMPIEYYEELEQQPVPKKYNCEHTLIIRLVHVTLTVVILVILFTMLGIAISSLRDANDTISDLKEMLPEARKTLQMVNNICHSPNFSSYCS